MALLETLKSPALYVGALGSNKNNAKRRERLLQYFDLTQTKSHDSMVRSAFPSAVAPRRK